MNKLKDKNKSVLLSVIQHIFFIVEIFMYFWPQQLSKLWKEERKLKWQMQSDIYWSENCLTCFNGSKIAWIIRKSFKDYNFGSNLRRKKIIRTSEHMSRKSTIFSKCSMKVFTIGSRTKLNSWTLRPNRFCKIRNLQIARRYFSD